jgi:DNA-binding MarR family transcriptional regulator
VARQEPRRGSGEADPDDVTRVVAFFRFFWWEWAHRLSRSGMLEEASGLDLPHSAQLILVRLRSVGSATVSELADMLDLDRSTVSRQIRPLKELGLVRRATSGDRRANRIELSVTGDDAARAMDGIWRREWERALGGLDPVQLSTLATLLERVREGMSPDDPSADPRE